MSYLLAGEAGPSTGAPDDVVDLLQEVSSGRSGSGDSSSDDDDSEERVVTSPPRKRHRQAHVHPSSA